MLKILRRPFSDFKSPKYVL